MDLSTTYMGMSLKNPLVPSAAPVSESVDKIRQMEDAGAEEKINTLLQALDAAMKGDQ